MGNPDSATHLAVSEASPSSSHLVAPRAGDRIGRYVVERMIGSGGMGYVVAARHEQLGELAAVKLLHPRGNKDRVQVERFVREARAMAKIKSEHVVRVLDVGQHETTGAPFIVMEHLEGRDLGQVLQESGPLPCTEAVDYVLQVCDALATAHALGIVHRDLKPSNLFLAMRADGTSVLKVLDFGIAKAMGETGDPDPRLTETQAVFGSPTYMSPEQIRSAKNVDARADIWSIGVALFELLTGKLPFIADNVAGLLASIVADPPLRASTFVQLPQGLDAVILGCLEKDASRRIGTVVELAARLAPFASAEGQRLADRLGRIGSSPGMPLSRPSIPAPAPSAPPLALGTTGVELDRTVAAPRGKAGVIGVILFVVAGALVGAFAFASYRRTAPPAVHVDPAAGTEPPPSASAAPPEPPPSASAEPAAHPAPATSTKAPPRASTPTTRATAAKPVASATAKASAALPPPPTVANPPPKAADPTDSRF